MPVRVKRLSSATSSRFLIGEDIGPPEAVDRLLRIADQKKREVRVGVNLSEDIVLDRVGILKFVDEGCPVFFPEVGGERPAAVSIQRLIEIIEKIVEKADILFPLQDREGAPCRTEQVPSAGQESALRHFSEVPHTCQRMDEPALFPLVSSPRQFRKC